jgi:hypothetical protein
MVQGPMFRVSICLSEDILNRALLHTWTYSTTLLSPRSRVAETLVAGNAFGTTFRTVRRRELVTDSDDMVTILARLSTLAYLVLNRRY